MLAIEDPRRFADTAMQDESDAQPGGKRRIRRKKTSEVEGMASYPAQTHLAAVSDMQDVVNAPQGDRQESFPAALKETEKDPRMQINLLVHEENSDPKSLFKYL
ncbi:MAG: hypothetical protein LLG04_03625 [Parachlamydia sp.]|nr:hypothetical protein [Parachlamydia sp.]